MLYGAIEAGGTKFVCAVSDEELAIKKRISIKTTTPEETMAKVIAFFDEYPVVSTGVGSFGPIDVNKKSPTYGYITSTPKLAWANFDFIGALKERYNIPIAWTTDVNAAAYGELKKGAAQGKTSCIYITVGTGIGGGVVIDGKIINGYGHPELGHMLVRRHPEDDYKGTCPYHGDCLEGVAAGPSIENRLGVKGQDTAENHPVWQIEAYYLAQGMMNYTLVLSPEIIVMGGGVMKQQQLFPLIHEAFTQQMAEYVKTPQMADYIVPCMLGDNAGITGCLLLAIEEMK